MNHQRKKKKFLEYSKITKIKGYYKIYNTRVSSEREHLYVRWGQNISNINSKDQSD